MDDSEANSPDSGKLKAPSSSLSTSTKKRKFRPLRARSISPSPSRMARRSRNTIKTRSSSSMTVKTHDSDGNYSGSDEKKIRRSPRLRLSDEEDEGYNSSSDNNSGGNSGGNNSSNSNSNRYSYSSGSGGASRSMSKRRKHNQTNGEEASSKASLNMDDGKHMVRSSSNSSLNTATNRGNKNKKKPRMKLVEFRTDGTSYQPRRVAHNILKVRPVAKPQNMIQWDIPPATILIIKKSNDAQITSYAGQICDWLKEQGKKILVEQSVHDSKELTEYEAFNDQTVDFCICLGGDGTILHLNSLFQNQETDQGVPPTISFACGSLGFLTAFKFEDFKQHLERVFNTHETPVYVSLRMRLMCSIIKAGETEPSFTHEVLNELLVDRGTSPYLNSLELEVDGRYVTHVQADGLIVSTPTGSTAYSMSAGGSMIAPTVPGILLTPICPHCLSFRPLVLPDSSTINIIVPQDARHNAYASFDGRGTHQLSKGDMVQIRMSHWPLPTLTTGEYNTEWFDAITKKLNWNLRVRQGELSW